MIFQGEALEMEADQIARQNVGHRLRIFFLQRDPVAQLHAAGPALRPMRERSAGPRPGERSNVEAPSLAQVVVKKARRKICAVAWKIAIPANFSQRR